LHLLDNVGMATKSTKRSKPTKKPATRQKPASRRKAGGSASNDMQQISRAVFRPEVGGVLLVLLAIFTLLSLLTASRGQLTGGWIDLLTALFGVGVWGVSLCARRHRAVDGDPRRRSDAELALAASGWRAHSFYECHHGVVVVVGAGGARTRDRRRRRRRPDGSVSGGCAGAHPERCPGAWAFVTFLLVSGVVLVFDRILVAGWYALQDQQRAPRGREAAPPAARLCCARQATGRSARVVAAHLLAAVITAAAR
jgi:hypothetical protein